MFLFETILFYENAPCFYKVYAKEDNRYYWEAQPHFYYSHISFPSFTVVEEGNDWQAIGLNDEALLKQVVKDLQSHLLYS